MCLAVYLAADAPLPHIPWNQEARGFYVTELDTPKDGPVRGRFSKPYVYYAGSHLMCGCGFNYGQYPDAEDDPAELELKANTMRQLSAYLGREVARVGPIEVYACWEGDQDQETECRRQLDPQAFDDATFVFREKELMLVQFAGERE